MLVAFVSGSGSWTVNENVTLPPITFAIVRFVISKGGVLVEAASGAACMPVLRVVAASRASVWNIMVEGWR